MAAQELRTGRRAPLRACIFDVDGVLLASPHEQAWRDALSGIADARYFTTAVYQACVAGKPRLDGAVAALQALGVPDAVRLAPEYAARKQQRLEELVESGLVLAYPDALRFVQTLASVHWKLAVASSSKNATEMMQPLRFGTGESLLDSFAVNVCGRDVPHGKPDPAIFLLAAAELGVPSAQCLVVEDAPAGIEAASAGGMTALGVARHHDGASLRESGANLVVTNLDEVEVEFLRNGQLRRRPK